MLDLGSGTGRFTPLLAETFGGPVYGVEPAARMRAVAEADAAHERVTYLDGAAEAIPLPDSSCELALLFLTFHHFVDQPAALRELARVLRPGGVVLMRSPIGCRTSTGTGISRPRARSTPRCTGRWPRSGRWLPTPGWPHPRRRSRASLTARRRWSTCTTGSSCGRCRLSSTCRPTRWEAGFAEFAADAAADPDRQMPVFAPDLLVLRR